uniref:Putative kunitz-type trypsin inhibitor n=1 Tax=Ixodes ricinus TaxID=34613 RepID=V5H669_IXORI
MKLLLKVCIVLCAASPTILCPWTFPVKARICASPPEGGPCDVTFERWNYNKSTGICSKFLYGGCFGNANNFDTEERCLACCDFSLDW